MYPSASELFNINLIPYNILNEWRLTTQADTFFFYFFFKLNSINYHCGNIEPEVLKTVM